MSLASPANDTFSLNRGHVPLLVSMPHVGCLIPPELEGDFRPEALASEDTDWHLDLLYDFLPRLGAGVLQAQVSRYVIDLNRPPDDQPMYPGAANTELCPTRFFTGEPLYRPGAAPSADARERRKSTFWQPYHAALAAELDRLRQIHGFVLLWDAHSIRSEIPWLFDGVLPDLNLGTADGASADPSIAAAVLRACGSAPRTTVVLNGRFKGGYITRHYGNPSAGIHAIQLEMCQKLYMREAAPYAYRADLARQVQPLLEAMIVAALEACATRHAR